MILQPDMKTEILKTVENVFIFFSIWSVWNSFSEAIFWHFVDPVITGVSATAIVALVLAICVSPILLFLKCIRRLQVHRGVRIVLVTILPTLLLITALPNLGSSPWARTLLLASGTALAPFILAWVVCWTPASLNKQEYKCSTKTCLGNCTCFWSSSFSLIVKQTQTQPTTEGISRKAVANAEVLVAIFLSMTLRWCSATINVLYETWQAPLVLLLTTILVVILKKLRIAIFRKQKTKEKTISKNLTAFTAMSSQCETQEYNSVHSPTHNGVMCSTNNRDSTRINTESPGSEVCILNSRTECKIMNQENRYKKCSTTPQEILIMPKGFLFFCGIIEGIAFGSYITLFQWMFSTPNLLCRWSGKDPHSYGVAVLACFALSVMTSSWEPHLSGLANLKQRQSNNAIQAVHVLLAGAIFVAVVIGFLFLATVLQLSSSTRSVAFVGSCIFSLTLPYCLSLNLQSIYLIVTLSNSFKHRSCFMNAFPGIIGFVAALTYITFYTFYINFFIPQFMSIFLGRIDIILFSQVTIILLSLFTHTFVQWHVTSFPSVTKTQTVFTRAPSSLRKILQAKLTRCFKPVFLTLISVAILGLGLVIGPLYLPNQCVSQHNDDYQRVLNFTTSRNTSIFSVMSWNLLIGHDTFGRDNLPCVGRIIDHIQPDIVALQEADALPMYWGGKDILGYLSGYLGENFKVHPGVNPLESTLGVGMLTKLQVFKHSTSKLPEPLRGNMMRYSMTKSDVQLGNTTLRLITVHAVFKNWTASEENPSPFANLSATQLKFIATQVTDTSCTQPVIIMGDFNLNPNEPQLDILHDVLGFKSALHPNRHLNPPSTIQNRFAIIDHIFYRGLNLLKSKTLKETGNISDHYPVLAYFEMPT